MLFRSPTGGRVEADADMADRLRAAGYTPMDEVKPAAADKPKARRAPRKPKMENELAAEGE